MPRYTGHTWDAPSKFKKAADAFMPQVMKMQVFNAEKAACAGE